MNNFKTGKNIFGLSSYGSSGLYVDLLTNQSINGIKSFNDTTNFNSNITVATNINVNGDINSFGNIYTGINSCNILQTDKIIPYFGTVINVNPTSEFNFFKTFSVKRVRLFSSSTTGDIFQILRTGDDNPANGYYYWNNTTTCGYISSGIIRWELITNGGLFLTNDLIINNSLASVFCNNYKAQTTNTYLNRIEMSNLYSNPTVGEIDIISQYIAVVHPLNTLSVSAYYGFFRTFTDGNTDFDVNNIGGSVWGTNWSSRLFYTDYTFQCRKAGLTVGYRYSKFMNSATEIGSISMLTTSTVAFNTSSDYRLKQDIEPIKNPLERLLKLKPVNYRFIHDVEEGYENFIFDGFIAHEVEDIIPMAVSGTKDDPNIMQQLDYSKFTPLLTGALQELNDKVDKQQEMINKQQEMIDKQQEMIDKQQEMIKDLIILINNKE